MCGPGGEGAEGAWLALLRSSEMLPTPCCSLLLWLQWEPGLPPILAVVSWAPEPCTAQEKLGRDMAGKVAGTERGSVLAISDCPHECFAWTPNGFAYLG